MPDKAYVYIAGIEDGEYKEEKLGCMLFSIYFFFCRLLTSPSRRLGQRIRLRHELHQKARC